jgi:hypothetical protein
MKKYYSKKKNYTFLLDESVNKNSYIESLFTNYPTSSLKETNKEWIDWLKNFDKETFDNAYKIIERKRLEYIQKNVILRENFLPRDEKYKTDVINAINEYITTRKFEFIKEFSNLTNIDKEKLKSFILSLNKQYIKFEDMLPLFDDSYFGQFYNEYMRLL